MKPYAAYIFDLDGTVYLGDALLPTAGETITRLRERGARTVFLSNNPTHSRAEYAAKLTRLGLPTPESDIIHSSTVLCDYLQAHMPAARLFVIGEAPLCEALQQAGFTLCDNAEGVQAVIASFDRTFTYRKLQIGFDALRAGARFFATNADPYIRMGVEAGMDTALTLTGATRPEDVSASLYRPTYIIQQLGELSG